MFALRWLIIYHYAFLNKGFDDLTELFCKMEEEEFSRNYDIGEMVYVNGFVYSSSTHEYPVKIRNASDIDINNMTLMIEATKEKIVLVRGYDLLEQMRTKQNSDVNFDG